MEAPPLARRHFVEGFLQGSACLHTRVGRSGSRSASGLHLWLGGKPDRVTSNTDRNQHVTRSLHYGRSVVRFKIPLQAEYSPCAPAGRESSFQETLDFTVHDSQAFEAGVWAGRFYDARVQGSKVVPPIPWPVSFELGVYGMRCHYLWSVLGEATYDTLHGRTPGWRDARHGVALAR